MREMSVNITVASGVKITMASGQRAAASVQPDFWLCG
jgi:hypothetical protein